MLVAQENKAENAVIRPVTLTSGMEIPEINPHDPIQKTTTSGVLLEAQRSIA